MQPGDWPRGHSPLARPGEGKVPTDLLGFCPNPGKVMLGGRSGWMGKGRLGEGPQEKVRLGGEPQEKLAWVWTTSHPYPHPTKGD